MSERERLELLRVLAEGLFNRFWYTRNYRVVTWDGSEYWTRLVYCGEAGIAKCEAGEVRIEHPPELGEPMMVETLRLYQTEDARHFVDSIVRFC